MVAITGYTDPGVSIEEVQVPGSVSLTSSRSLCVVGIAPRTRRSTDEVVIRGKIYDEALSSWSSSSPYRHLLANPSNRDRTQAILYKNGNGLGLGEWSFVAAALVGLEWAGATVDVSSGTGTAQYFTLTLDGKIVVTIDLDAAVTAVGGAPAAATATDICDAINYDLGNVAGAHFTNYGTSYASVATHATGAVNEILTLTSPLTTSASDVKILLSLSADGASIISNAGWAPTATVGVQAPTYVEVIDSSYTSTATWTIEYVGIDSLSDPLDNATATTPLQDLIRVGAYQGASTYLLNTDYGQTGNTIDWDVAAWVNAAVAATVAGPYNTAALTNLYISVNAGAVLTVALTSGAATTAATLAADINTALVASTSYGPAFAHFASDNAGTLEFAYQPAFDNFPVEHGYASSVVFYTGAADAFQLFFGAAVSQPYEVRGTGERPDFGAVYYSTYNYTRPSEDYDFPVKVYDPSGVLAYTSPLTATNYVGNDLAIAGLIAFDNFAPTLWLMQINDSTAPGIPTTTQIHTAIDLCGEKSGITEVVVLDTTLDTAVYLQSHVSSMSSSAERKPRRGWYGMERGVAVGDPDTPDTLVHRATRTLQPGNTSPGRGRQILVAPTECSRVLTLEDNTEVTIELDGNYIATAVAAYFTSLPGAADSMVRKTIQGFEIDTFEEYVKGERHTLADNGTTVVTLDAGNFRMLDPLTTEAGGAGVVSYEEPAASWQRDILTSSVGTLIDNNLVGVVPTNVADFIVSTMQWIMLAIKANIENGTIGPYRDAAGNVRDIDPSSDIKVWQSESDPRTFYFRYWYNLKYPAKRFFGEYSVDNPFWGEE